MREIWKTVEGYEGLLEVSDQGRVKGLASIRSGTGKKPEPQRRPGCFFRPFRSHSGYLVVAPKVGDARRKHQVHRLVAKAFVAGHFEGATVNHINGVKIDNRAANLEWVTLARNTELQWATGLVNLRGERHPSSKLTDAQTGEIKRRVDAGETCLALAREFRVSDALIGKIRRGVKRVPT